MGLTISVLDIWGPDKVKGRQINVWGSEEEKPEPSAKEVKGDGSEKGEEEPVLKAESKKEEEVPKEEPKEKEEPIASV